MIMSYEIFVKKLGSQESGYSGDKPDQRGKYILIPKKHYSVFPYLSKTTLNDQSVIRCKILGGAEIAVNIVYHNAKYFPAILKRDHDEVRLYRNSKLDKALNLDRGVIVIVAKLKNGAFGFVSVQKNDTNYQYWDEIATKVQKIDDIYNLVKGISEIKNLASLDNNSFNESIQNSTEAIEQYTKRLVEARKQQTEYIHNNDPAKPLESLINNQDTFKKYVRMMYDGKCALRRAPLVLNDYVGLEAAHIHPHSHKGPLLPTNGILLSKDLHAAFEDGFFTLDDENKVLVSNKVESGSDLWEFNNQLITPIAKYKIYEPFSSYTKWHRNQIFERKF
jgi:hypothetical protein